MANRDLPKPRTGPTRVAFLVAGFCALGLAILGIPLPVLPTTPFLLLACACFLRSSRRMYAWVHRNRVFGAYLLNYEKRQMRRRDKIVTLVVLWASIGAAIAFMPVLWPKVLLAVVAVGVTWHLSTLTST